MKKLKDLDSYQRACIEFIKNGEDSLICADIGTGKTVISLTAAGTLLDEGRVTRWLVLAPLLVATDTWAKESSEWTHLHHDVAIACGTEDQRINAIESNAKIVVINYENLPWLMAHYPKARNKKDSLPFDGLICDEIDKLKSVSSERFKQFRNRIGKFNMRVGLTGTLVPNDLTEVWGQTYMVDGGESFGRSFYAWRKKYFYPTDYNQYNWAPFPATEKKILKKISDLAFRLKATEVPEVELIPPEKLTLSAAVRPLYNELEKEFYLIVKDDDDMDREIDAANAAVLSGKLQQICAGFSYVDKTSEAVWHTKAKLDWCTNVCANLDAQVLIVYQFKEELAELRRRFPGLNYLGGGVSNKKALGSINRWNSGEIQHLAIHPASASHGLNLQKSGAHHIVFLTVPWSGGMFNQVIGRLARRGQRAKKVFLHTAVFDNTIDNHVLRTATGRSQFMKTFLGRLHAATKN